MPNDILVIVERADTGIKQVSLEALGAARQLAAGLGGQVKALLLGAAISATETEKVAKGGADWIGRIEAPILAEYLTEPYTTACAAAIRHLQPMLVLLGATNLGRDLAARLAARLNAALAMDAVALRLQDGQLRITRPMYGGKLLAEVQLDDVPQLVTLRPHAAKPSTTAGAGEVEVLPIDPGTSRVELVEKQIATGKIELTEANIVVSGGRGLGSGPAFATIEALADALGAAVGASRAAVDENWRSLSDQVGQTGKVVAPRLYIACGISGAIQHLAGMQTAEVIVAINSDPDAPIFGKADYGIVGDLSEVLPAICEAVQELKKA